MCTDPGRPQREAWKADTKKLSSFPTCPGLVAAFCHSVIKYREASIVFQVWLRPPRNANEHYNRGGGDRRVNRVTLRAAEGDSL